MKYFALLLPFLLWGCQRSPQIKTDADITYNSPQNLLLDLHIPEIKNSSPLPVILYIHGGGWLGNSKANCPALPLAQAGYGVACINYRYSSQALFPAQLEDVKSAVIWLKNNAIKYNLNPQKIGVVGDSAGGHLSALLGTAADLNTRVQAVVSWYGPTDFSQVPPAFDEPLSEQVLEKSKNQPWFLYTVATHRLLGGSISQKKALAKQANPLTYIDPQDPPFLLIHGELDDVVPIQQSELLYKALKSQNVPVKFIRLPQLVHDYRKDRQEGTIKPEILEPTLNFFAEYLQTD
jgi:acetyl esterase/lipase